MQAAQAIRAAMPILPRAERVIVFRVGAVECGPAVPDLLEPLPVELRTVRGLGDDVGLRLLELVRDVPICW